MKYFLFQSFTNRSLAYDYDIYRNLQSLFTNERVKPLRNMANLKVSFPDYVESYDMRLRRNQALAIHLFCLKQYTPNQEERYSNQ